MKSTRQEWDQEDEANLFAMCLLIPEKLIRADMDKIGKLNVDGDDRVRQLARRYCVTEQLMVNRLVKLGYLLCAMVLLSSCGTPFSVSGGFFGASVSVDFPEGIKPVPVTKTASVSTPTLMVPPDSTITSGTVPVTTASGQTTSVSVTAAPVTSPILAVPAK
jgi:hypothetical protein